MFIELQEIVGDPESVVTRLLYYVKLLPVTEK